MAQVSTLHGYHQRSNVQQQEQSRVQTLDSMANCSTNNNEDDHLYAIDFNSLSPPNLPFFIPSTSHPQISRSDSETESESDCSDSVTNLDCFYGEDQMNFVTDLFKSREEYVPDDSDSVSEPFLEDTNNDVDLRGFEGSADDDFGTDDDKEELGFGFGVEFDRETFASESSEYPTTLCAESSGDGLWVGGIKSDSDAEEVDTISEVSDDDTYRNSDSDSPIFLNCLRFDDRRAGSEEFEWEEVDEMVDEREGLRSVIDRIEEMSVSSETSSEVEDANDMGEEAVPNLEWEVLLAVNNLERNIEFDNDVEGDGVSNLAVQDDYIYATEYDTLFGQFVESASALKVSPPAAKSVVQNLASVVFTKEELRGNNVVCAVCKDEIIMEEKVTRLPCRHHYHGECIVPWLGIRNTCPVCRYELPTDDVDYERRKNGRGDRGLLDDLQVRYNFELLP